MTGARAKIVVDSDERAVVELDGVRAPELDGAPVENILQLLIQRAAASREGKLYLETWLPDGTRMYDIVRANGSVVTAVPNPGRRSTEVFDALVPPELALVVPAVIPEIVENVELPEPEPVLIPAEIQAPAPVLIYPVDSDIPLVEVPAPSSAPVLIYPADSEPPAIAPPETEGEMTAVTSWRDPLDEEEEIDLEVEMVKIAARNRTKTVAWGVKSAVVLVLVSISIFIGIYAAGQFLPAPGVPSWLPGVSSGGILLSGASIIGITLLKSRTPKR